MRFSKRFIRAVLKQTFFQSLFFRFKYRNTVINPLYESQLHKHGNLQPRTLCIIDRFSDVKCETRKIV